MGENETSVPTISTGMKLMPVSIEEKLHLCDILIKSNLLPKEITKKEEAFAILAYGHELGYGPMESFQKIFVVKGRPGLYANALLGKVREHPDFVGVKIESDNKHATITLKRKGISSDEPEEMTISFGEEDAKRAGLMKEDSGYKKYPERMYRARVISWACRDLFPNAAKNMISVEELEDLEYEKAETIKTITMDLGARDDDNKPILEAIQITKSYEDIAEYLKSGKLTDIQKIQIAKAIKINRAPSLIKIKIEKWLQETEKEIKPETPKEEKKEAKPTDKKEDKPKDKKPDKNATTEKQDKKLQDLLKTHVLTEEEKKRLQELATDKEGASTAIEIALDDMKARKKIEDFIMGIVEGIPKLTAENLKTLQEKPGKQGDLRDYILNETPDLDPEKFNDQIKGALNL